MYGRKKVEANCSMIMQKTQSQIILFEATLVIKQIMRDNKSVSGNHFV